MWRKDYNHEVDFQKLEVPFALSYLIYRVFFPTDISELSILTMQIYSFVPQTDIFLLNMSHCGGMCCLFSIFAP